MLQFNSKVKISKPKLKVRNVEYVHYWTSTDGNEAYISSAFLGSKEFLCELILLSNKKWCFHVELKDLMIFDSRLGNKYFDTASEAHLKMVSAIVEKYERKESAKFTKVKSTKKR